MPNLVKHNTSTETQALRKGNFYLAVGDVPKGLTSESGFWTGYDVPPGGYVIYLDKSFQGPSIYAATSDEELVSLVNRISSSSFTSLAQALGWAAGQTGVMIVNKQYPAIITQGLVMNLDASFTTSYPSGGTVWYDTSPLVNNGSLSNGPTFSNNGYFSFDGVDDFGTVSNNSSLQITGDQTLEFIVYPKRRSVRQNWYNKAYGGEGTITYETGGALNYFWGTSGVNAQPYQGVTTNGTPLATLNLWYHVTLVRELSTPSRTVKWYINGVLNRSVAAAYTAATAGSASILIGRGYTNNFQGDVGFARQYNIALSQAQVLQNYYQAPIVTENLVFSADPGNLVSFEPGTTTAYSLANPQFSGSLVNGVGYSSADSGKWVFDGVNDYLFFSGTPDALEGNPNFTVCGFFRRTENSLVQSGFWGIGGSATDQGINNWNSGNTNQITIDMWGRSTFTTGQTYPLNQWIFVAWQKVAGNMTRANCTIWVNTTSYTGSQLSIIRGESGPPNINNLGITLGSINNSTTYPSGVDIGCIYIYDRVLSGDEVLQNFNAQRTRFGI